LDDILFICYSFSTPCIFDDGLLTRFSYSTPYNLDEIFLHVVFTVHPIIWTIGFWHVVLILHPLIWTIGCWHVVLTVHPIIWKIDCWHVVLHQVGIFVLLHRFIYLFNISTPSLSSSHLPVPLLSAVQDCNPVATPHAVFFFPLPAHIMTGKLSYVFSFPSVCMLGKGTAWRLLLLEKTTVVQVIK